MASANALVTSQGHGAVEGAPRSLDGAGPDVQDDAGHDDRRGAGEQDGLRSTAPPEAIEGHDGAAP